MKNRHFTHRPESPLRHHRSAYGPHDSAEAVSNGHVQDAIDRDRHDCRSHPEEGAAPAHSQQPGRWRKQVHQVGVPDVENTGNVNLIEGSTELALNLTVRFVVIDTLVNETGSNRRF